MLPVSYDWSVEFDELAKARMETSYHKYGPWAKNADVVDCIGNAMARLKIYQETGNKEGLVDARNFLMMEFMRPKHPNAHFRSMESHESPPLVCIKEDPFKKVK